MSATNDPLTDAVASALDETTKLFRELQLRIAKSIINKPEAAEVRK